MHHTQYTYLIILYLSIPFNIFLECSTIALTFVAALRLQKKIMFV